MFMRPGFYAALLLLVIILFLIPRLNIKNSRFNYLTFVFSGFYFFSLPCFCFLYFPVVFSLLFFHQKIKTGYFIPSIIFCTSLKHRYAILLSKCIRNKMAKIITTQNARAKVKVNI